MFVCKHQLLIFFVFILAAFLLISSKLFLYLAKTKREKFQYLEPVQVPTDFEKLFCLRELNCSRIFFGKYKGKGGKNKKNKNLQKNAASYSRNQILRRLKIILRGLVSMRPLLLDTLVAQTNILYSAGGKRSLYQLDSLVHLWLASYVNRP